MITSLVAGFIIMAVAFLIWTWVFPSKKYMSDIYQEMYRKQDSQAKILGDMRNVFFAKNRKIKKGGK